MHSFRIFVILALMTFSSALPVDVATSDVDATKVSIVASISSGNDIQVAGDFTERSQDIKFDLSNIIINSDDSINLAANSVGNILGHSPDHSPRGIGLLNSNQDIGGGGGVGGNINNLNVVKSDILNTIVGHGKASEGLSALSLVAGDVDTGLDRRGNNIGNGDQGGQVADQSVSVSLDAAGDSLLSGQGNTLSSVTNIYDSAAKDILI